MKFAIYSLLSLLAILTGTAALMGACWVIAGWVESGDLSSLFVAVGKGNLAFSRYGYLPGLRRTWTTLQQSPRSSGSFFNAEQLCCRSVTNFLNVGR